MTTDKQEPVLVFAGVSATDPTWYDAPIENLSFAVGAGELVLGCVDATAPHSPAGDLAQGLVAPSIGVVRFLGRDWQTESPDDAARQRARIGRTFDQGGWISNLDIDENITLSQRYHTGRAAHEIQEEARALAAELGLPEIPIGRASTVARFALRRAQWVRACLGAPALLVLERPGNDLPADWLEPLFRRVAKERERGAAVLWIDSASAESLAEKLKPTLQIDLRDGKMRGRDFGDGR